MKTARCRLGPALVCLAITLVVPSGAVRGQQDPRIRDLELYAQRDEGEGRTDSAITTYRNIVEQFPSSEAAPRALLRIALILRDNGDREGAETAAQQLVAGYLSAPEAAGGAFLLADYKLADARDPAALEDAYTDMRNLAVRYHRQQYPGLIWRSAALVKSGRVAWQLGSPNDAGDYLLQVLELEPPNRWTPQAYLLMAEIMLFRQGWRSSVDFLQELVDSRAQGQGELVDRAKRRLALVERHFLRPTIAELRWSRADTVSVGSVSWRRPLAVAARDDGSLLVYDRKGDAITHVRSDGSVAGSWVRPATTRLTWTDDGAIATDSQGASAWREGATSWQHMEFTPEDRKQPAALQRVLRTSFGRFFVLTDGPPQALLFDRDRHQVAELTAPRGHVPVDIANDVQGRLLVLYRQGEVLRFEANGAPLGKAAVGDWRAPRALATDGVGNLFVVDGGRRTVHVYDSNGRDLQTLGPALPDGPVELSAPEDISVDGAGRIYIADGNAGILLVQ